MYIRKYIISLAMPSWDGLTRCWAGDHRRSNHTQLTYLACRDLGSRLSGLDDVDSQAVR